MKNSNIRFSECQYCWATGGAKIVQPLCFQPLAIKYWYPKNNNQKQTHNGQSDPPESGSDTTLEKSIFWRMSTKFVFVVRNGTLYYTFVPVLVLEQTNNDDKNLHHCPFSKASLGHNEHQISYLIRTFCMMYE
jgi:hypothetical protein